MVLIMISYPSRPVKVAICVMLILFLHAHTITLKVKYAYHIDIQPYKNYYILASYIAEND